MKHDKKTRRKLLAGTAACALLLMTIPAGPASQTFAAGMPGSAGTPGTVRTAGTAVGPEMRPDTGIASVREIRIENQRLYVEGEVTGQNGQVAASLHDESNGFISSSPVAACKGKSFSLFFNLIRGTLENGYYYVVFGDIENTGISVRDLWSSGYKVSFQARDGQVLDTWKEDGSSGDTSGKDPQQPEQPEKENQSGEAGPPGDGASQPADAAGDIGGHWAETQIRGLMNKGILSGNGDGTFRPDAPVTRAEFAQIVGNAFDIKRGDAAGTGGTSHTGGPAAAGNGRAFSDVMADEWYFEAVMALAENGIVSGVSESSFAPNDTITREQMAVILCSAARRTHMDLAIKRDYTAFSDDSNLSDYAKEAVKTMYQAELISGVGAAEGNRFLPQAGATRAEVAVLVDKLLNQTK